MASDNSGDWSELFDIVGETEGAFIVGGANDTPVESMTGDVVSFAAFAAAAAFFRDAYAASLALFSSNAALFLSNAIWSSASCISRKASASLICGSADIDFILVSELGSPSLSESSSEVSSRSTTSRFGCGGANVRRTLLRKNVEDDKRDGGTSTKSAAPGRRELTGTADENDALSRGAEPTCCGGNPGDSALLVAMLCASRLWATTGEVDSDAGR